MEVQRRRQRRRRPRGLGHGRGRTDALRGDHLRRGGLWARDRLQQCGGAACRCRGGGLRQLLARGGPGHGVLRQLVHQGAIDGIFSFDSNAADADLVRFLALRARCRRALITEHVESHSGHPWNELADSLAGGLNADVPDCPFKMPHPPEGVLIGNADHLLRCMQDGGHKLPVVRGGRADATPPGPPCLDPELGMSVRKAGRVGGEWATFPLVCAQANVLSLDGGGAAAFTRNA